MTTFTQGQRVMITASNEKLGIPQSLVGKFGVVKHTVLSNGGMGCTIIVNDQIWAVPVCYLVDADRFVIKLAKDLVVGDRIQPVGHRIIAIDRGPGVTTCRVAAGDGIYDIVYNQMYIDMVPIKTYL